MDIRNTPDYVVELAKEFNVTPILHDKDFILDFLLNHPHYKNDPEGAYGYYFKDGHNSANMLYDLLRTHVSPELASLDICEFASGYGCVTRHLKSINPDCNITSIDVHENAVEFLKKYVGVKAKLSHKVPEKIDFSKKYDIVFALSFFSHMPDKTFFRWLKSLYSLVKTGGALMFTAHGEASIQHMPSVHIDKYGFVFYPYSEQRDLSSKDYGVTISLHSYVLNKIQKLKSAPEILFFPAFWWKHQNLYILKK